MGQSTEKLNEDIRGLYGTFLGKFEFFRRWAAVAWSIYDHINALNVKVKDVGDWAVTLKTDQEKLEECVETLQAKVNELEFQISVLKEKAPQEPFRRANEVMDAYYKAYNPTE